MSTKDIVLDVDISTKQRSNVNTHQEWRSYDHAAAQLVLHISKNSEKIDADSVKTVRLLITSIDAYSRVSKDLAYQFDVPIDTDSTAKCLLPDEIVCYDGRVAVHVYVEFKNGASNDVGQCFYIDFKPSAIDTTIEHVGEYYFKSFDDVLKEVNEIAVDVANAAEKTFDDMVNYEAGLDSYAESKKSEMDTVLVDVAKTGAAEKEKIKIVAIDEIEKIQSCFPEIKVLSTDEITKIRAELPKVETVAAEEIGKIRNVLSTVEQTAQEVSDHADQRIVEYDDKFVSTDQKMQELDQRIDEQTEIFNNADVYNKAEIEDKLEPFALRTDITEVSAQLAQKAKQTTFQNNYTQYFAHRGAESHVPENTLKAFELANTIGYDGIELDIWFSTDGVPFVFHDDNLERMTDGIGRADSKTISQIQSLNITSGNFINWNKGLKIPLLVDALTYAKKINKPVLIEVKGYHDNSNLITLNNMIVELGMQGLVVVFGTYSIVGAMQNIGSNLNIMIFYVDSAEFNAALDNTNVICVSFQYPEMTKNLVNEFHDKGKLVSVWTVIDRLTAKNMAELGVDIIVGSVRP